MTEAQFQEHLAAWITRTDAEALSGETLTAFRALCPEQAAAHSSAAWRVLFGRAAALPVVTVKVARTVSPFVEKYENRIS
jgi:hypothetical protein